MKKKRQHYVFQKYLESWTTNKQLWCMMNRKDIIKTNTINVGQEKYFYAIKDFTKKDLQVAKELVHHNKDSFYSDYWVDMYELVLKLKDYTKQETADKELVEAIGFLTNHIEQEINCGVENRLLPFLEKMLEKDLSFLNSDENKFMLCFCLMEQFSRTKMMKEQLLNDIPEIKNCNFENVWALVRHSYDGFLGFVLAAQNMNFCLLYNKEGNFITGDQPIVSTKFDWNKEIIESEYYYPLSPSLALIITKDKNYPHMEIVDISLEDVEKFNMNIVCNSNFQIYSNSKEILEKYKERDDYDNICR